MNKFFSILSALLLFGSLCACHPDRRLGEDPDNKYKDAYRVLFQANFDGIGSPFSEFILLNDANKVNEHYHGFYDAAWVCHPMSLYNGNKDNNMLVSCAWFETPTQADRWLISPAFEVEGENPFIYWEEMTPDTMHPHSYALLVAPDGGSGKSSFTETIYSIPASESGAAMNAIRSASLRPFIGKKIRVAFVNNATDGFLLAIDNIYAVAKEVNHNPINLSVHKVGLTTANAVFTDEDNKTGEVADSKRYQVSLVPFATTDITTGKLFTSTTLQFAFSGLTSATRYHAYLKSGESNHWSGPYPVQTAYEMPFASDLNGNIKAEGWSLEDMDVASSPINGSLGFVARSIPGDVALAKAKTPPIAIEKNKPFTLSFDCLTEELAGSVSVMVYSDDPNDRGDMVEAIDFVDPYKPNTPFQVSRNNLILRESGTYYFEFMVFARAEEAAQKQDFKIYIDNVQIAYDH